MKDTTKKWIYIICTIIWIVFICYVFAAFYKEEELARNISLSLCIVGFSVLLIFQGMDIYDEYKYWNFYNEALESDHPTPVVDHTDVSSVDWDTWATRLIDNRVKPYFGKHWSEKEVKETGVKRYIV